VSAGSRALVARAETHIPKKKLHRAPLGVNQELFAPAPDNHPNDQHVVHVATLTAIKDQATLLRAFARLRQQTDGVTLDVVGDGPLRAELERLAIQLGVADSVCFRGEIDHAALPAAYRAATAFALSSRHEAQGMVALEAAACGVPVVGTRVGVLPELTSAVVPVGADAALTDALAATLDAPPRTVRERMLAEFGLQTCTDRFRTLYADLADRRRASD
jgi:glycosyltransferase involved in cell wall biosynthesis